MTTADIRVTPSVYTLENDVREFILAIKKFPTLNSALRLV